MPQWPASRLGRDRRRLSGSSERRILLNRRRDFSGPLLDPSQSFRYSFQSSRVVARSGVNIAKIVAAAIASPPLARLLLWGILISLVITAIVRIVGAVSRRRADAQSTHRLRLHNDVLHFSLAR